MRKKWMETSRGTCWWFSLLLFWIFFVRTVSSTATDKNCHVIREQARVMAAADQDSPDSAKTHQVFRPTPGENLFFSSRCWLHILRCSISTRCVNLDKHLARVQSNIKYSTAKLDGRDSEYINAKNKPSPTPSSALNLGPLISRWEINKFENCWYKSVRILEVLKLLFQQFLNLSSSQRDMSGTILGDLSNNRWSGGNLLLLTWSIWLFGLILV